MRIRSLLIAAAILLGSTTTATAQQPFDTAAILKAMLGINIEKPTGKMPELADAPLWFNSKPLSSADLRGHVVLIDFWAYDCLACQEDLPNVIALDSAYRQKGLQVIAVHPAVSDFATDTANIHRWIKKSKIPYPIVYDSTGAIADAFHNIMYPNRFFIDKQGNIRDMSAKSTKRAIEALLAEKSDSVSVSTPHKAPTPLVFDHVTVIDVQQGHHVSR